MTRMMRKMNHQTQTSKKRSGPAISRMDQVRTVILNSKFNFLLFINNLKCVFLNIIFSQFSFPLTKSCKVILVSHSLVTKLWWQHTRLLCPPGAATQLCDIVTPSTDDIQILQVVVADTVVLYSFQKLQTSNFGQKTHLMFTENLPPQKFVKLLIYY